MISLTIATWFTSALHLDHSSSETKPPARRHRRSLWESFVDGYTHDPEPKVWQELDRQGHLCWHAYDPVTNRSFWCESEDEMRCWLEERYSYQVVNPDPDRSSF